ncbi:MAG TPA: hypothetical protein VM939_08425 [Gemmatimonadaceae bacterium]|nr:hypothetical protein [Gemmatimonadaceae bacterium]
MHSRRSVIALGMVLSILTAACDGDSPPAASDSAKMVAQPKPRIVRPAINPGWNEAIGPLLVVPPPEGSLGAAIVLPEVTDSVLAASASLPVDSFANISIELLNRQGKVGDAVIAGVDQRAPTDACPAWPQARIAGSPAAGWKIGFAKGRATAISLDSLERVSPSDSAAITMESARLASRVPGTSDPEFQGLPFAVRHAFRFRIGATSVVVANVVRKINQEANPREEHILLIAERESGRSAYEEAFHARTTGLEDVVQTSEVLAALRIAETGRTALIIHREGEEGGRIALIERRGAGNWNMRWVSAYAGC